MAVEKVFNEILNEPRYGSFSLTIIEGDSPQQTSAVPAIEMVHFGDEDEYIKKQRNKSPVPVLAFRSGGRGWCNVVVDERLIEVETVKLSIPGDRVNIFQEPMFKSVIKTTTIPPERFYKTLFVPPGVRGMQDELVSSLKITAKTKVGGLPFKATISFVPSK